MRVCLCVYIFIYTHTHTNTYINIIRGNIALSAWAVEYTNCNKSPGYHPNQSDGEAPVMMELWRMRSTYSLLSLPGQVLPGAPDTAQSMG